MRPARRAVFSDGMFTGAKAPETTAFESTSAISRAKFIAQAILLEASLSLLGLGVTEPMPAWA
jgi:hypothetical protein